MNKSPISVTMISGAEATRIGAALASVAEWAAEIVVVLNENVRDGTEEIAQKYGAKVFREPWKGFIGQKNSAAEKATQPWILNLDADEIVSPELAKEICEICKTASESGGPEVYEFPRCTFYCGKWIRHGDWYPDRVMRLWKKGAARWVGDEPHAALEFRGKLGRLKSDLLHHSNESIERQLMKIAPYQNGFVKKQLLAGKSSDPFSMAFRPWWRFVRSYFIRLGFLDGWQGYYIAKLAAFSALTRQAMLREGRINERLKK